MIHLRAEFLCVLLLVLAVLSLSACAPTISPLYRDYESPEEQGTMQRIETALVKAGWTLVPSDVPNTIATDEQTLSSWGLYKVIASLEVVPIGNEYVRVFVHPYRKYFTGSRSKIPFLNKSLQRAILVDLTNAFEAQGLEPLGTPRTRDEETASR